MDWMTAFDDALPYADFLDRHATPAHRPRWDAAHARVRLTPGQSELLGGFVRRMPVVCLAGAWCGDCVNQCPAFDHFARAAPALDLRFLDRDARPDVRDALAVNGGHRVPVVVFLSEDGFEVSRYGERTLSVYRKLAADRLGSACPTGLVAPPRRRLRPGRLRVARRIRTRPARPPPLPPPPAEVRGLIAPAARERISCGWRTEDQD